VVLKFVICFQSCQPFFKLLSLLTDTTGGGPSGLPCFSQLILNRIWEAAEQCPQSTLEWLAIQVPRNKMAATWVLESIDKWVEPYLIAHNNNRVRNGEKNTLKTLLMFKSAIIAVLLGLKSDLFYFI